MDQWGLEEGECLVTGTIVPLLFTVLLQSR